MDQPADYQKLGINPSHIEAWEDGRRDTSAAGHGEIWYFDCSFDDGSTLVLGFRPKSPAAVGNDHDNPNIAINYTPAEQPTFNDYRLYNLDQVNSSQTTANLQWGPNSLTSPQPWHTYDVKVVDEGKYPVAIDGKSSTDHTAQLSLHFEAQTEPFRPGTGYVVFGAKEQYYYNFICITKLTVNGHLRINGEDKEVTGSAYYNHQWFNISPAMAFHHWFWGRQNIGKYSVLLYDMVGAPQFGCPQIPLFTIDDDQGHRVLESVRAEDCQFEILASELQAETGKQVPTHFRYTFSQGAVKATFEIVAKQVIQFLNIYGDSSAPVQERYDQMDLQPTYNRYLADTTLTIERNGMVEQLAGTMLYELNFTAKEIQAN